MQNNKIIFSIIIPYKGRFNFVKQAIKSVLNQNGVGQEQIEILAVSMHEGGKSTKSKLKRIFPQVIFLDNQDREGPGGNRNTGLKYAKGEYIVFLDSDDRLKSNFCSSLKMALEKDKKVLAAICLSSKYFEKGFSETQKIKRIPHILIQDSGLLLGYLFNKKYLFRSSYFLCLLSQMMFKKTALKGFSFNYDYRRGGEDWDLVTKVLKKGKIRILPERLIIFRFSPQSSTFEKESQKLKWQSYSLLNSRLSNIFKKGLYYQLFLFYTKLSS